MPQEKVYQEFQKAADRHLKTCLELKKVIEAKTADKDNGLRKQLIQDLYYLSGYIIECSCCYYVYSYRKFKDFTEREELVATQDENIAYEKSGRRDSNSLIIKSTDHSLTHFKTMLQKFPSDYRVSGVPVLNGHTTDFINEALFVKWGANIRYKIPEGLTCDKDAVFSFLEVAEKLNKGVNNYLNSPSGARS